MRTYHCLESYVEAEATWIIGSHPSGAGANHKSSRREDCWEAPNGGLNRFDAAREAVYKSLEVILPHMFQDAGRLIIAVRWHRVFNAPHPVMTDHCLETYLDIRSDVGVVEIRKLAFDAGRSLVSSTGMLWPLADL